MPRPTAYTPEKPKRSLNVSALVLVIVSVLTTVWFGVIGPPSAVMGLLSLKHAAGNREKSDSLAKNGWLVFGVNAAIGLIAIALFFWWRRNS